MSQYSASEEAKTLMAVLAQYLDLETALQNAYDQGVADTIDSANGKAESFFE